MPYQPIEREISPILFTMSPPHYVQLKRGKRDTGRFSHIRHCQIHHIIDPSLLPLQSDSDKHSVLLLLNQRAPD